MPALSIQPPFPIFTDRGGEPLDAGYVYIGAANLDPQGNPIVVYWDAALTQPAAQPIRTINGYPSNAGTPGRLYVDATDYSLRVLDKNGALVYSAATATERFSSVLVTFQQDGAGAVTRTVQGKLRDVFSFEDFGAVGDNSADDTAAIQAAIDAVAALGIARPGGKIYGKPGATYRITNTIFLRDHIKIDLCGSAIVQYGSNIPIISAPTGQTIWGWSLKNGNLVFATKQTAAQTNGIGLRLANGSSSYDFEVDHVEIGGACIGIMCPSTSGTFAFVGQIRNYIGNDCSLWSMFISCDSTIGGNTNLVFVNCWALISNPSNPLYAGARGFYFNACAMSQWQSLYADRIRGQFIFAQTCSGAFGVLSLEASQYEVATSQVQELISFVDTPANVDAVKFVLNDFKTYNEMIANITATINVGDTITGVTSGATAEVRSVSGAGAGQTITFYEINGLTFTPTETINVSGVGKGTVTSLPGSSGQIWMFRGLSTQPGRSFSARIGQYLSSNNTYKGANIWNVVPSANSPPNSGPFWVYNDLADLDRVAQLADFGTTKQIRYWNGDNRYYTLGMTADAAWDGDQRNLVAVPMDAANSFSGYVASPYDRNMRFRSTAFGFNRDGGLTLCAFDGTTEYYLTEALRLRTDGGGTPRLSQVAPDSGAGWEVLTSVAGTETRRLAITQAGNVLAGAPAVLSTSATDGFLYVPTCAGTPTGVPTAITGYAPIVINTTNNKLYFYSGGAWRDAGP